jgi:hypothetical protein
VSSRRVEHFALWQGEGRAFIAINRHPAISLTGFFAA